jgi:3-deoxy-manno-octulosonate cytidylyltransferase (CMP-KDO synthetase)
VATDDQRIADAVTGFGGRVCLTRADHTSGTDRLQEVATQQQWPDEAIVVNVQGDEPLMPAAVIDQVANNLATHSSAGVATVSETITETNVFTDPNAVKVVRSEAGYALYFSRAPIPWPRDTFHKGLQGQEGRLPDTLCAQRHIGIYAYRVAFLHQFVCWPAGALEKTESLEQLRALAHGIPIHVEPACEVVPAGVDTAQDLEAVRKLFE